MQIQCQINGRDRGFNSYWFISRLPLNTSFFNQQLHFYLHPRFINMSTL